MFTYLSCSGLDSDNVALSLMQNFDRNSNDRHLNLELFVCLQLFRQLDLKNVSQKTQEVSENSYKYA